MGDISHLVVVMPAFNEADGLPGFLRELEGSLSPLAQRLSFVVRDDLSTDGTAEVLSALDFDGLTVLPAEVNRGHGPSALAAYRGGLALDPDLLVHIDGDGQFLGDDVRRVVQAAVDSGADVVHGVRRNRSDPWFRKVITNSLRVVSALITRRAVPDINTPLRVYRPEAIGLLLDSVGADASVPHVHFSLAEARSGFVVRYVGVESIPRRGESETGTMWGDAPKQPVLPPKRLRQFVLGALAELWQLSLRPGARMRSVVAPGREGSE